MYKDIKSRIMKINELKIYCNIDFDELKRLKNELSNLYDDEEE